jgi:hypothetical protein
LCRIKRIYVRSLTKSRKIHNNCHNTVILSISNFDFGTAVGPLDPFRRTRMRFAVAVEHRSKYQVLKSTAWGVRTSGSLNPLIPLAGAPDFFVPYPPRRFFFNGTARHFPLVSRRDWLSLAAMNPPVGANECS